MFARHTGVSKHKHDEKEEVPRNFMMTRMTSMVSHVVQLFPVTKKTRRSYTYQEKAAYLEKYFEICSTDGAVSYRVVEEQLKPVTRPVIQRWVQQKEDIFSKVFNYLMK